MRPWISTVLACLILLSPVPARAAKGFEYFVVGNPADVSPVTGGLLVLQGGGTDLDENFVRMGSRAGGGDFVVIRASGTDAYNAYIYELCGCDSVATLIFKNRQDSSDPFVVDGHSIWEPGRERAASPTR